MAELYDRESPPSRAAWIEIFYSIFKSIDALSRRLHGRRGLKSFLRPRRRVDGRSPPSRAAWIEIYVHSDMQRPDAVAAFTGGVD